MISAQDRGLAGVRKLYENQGQRARELKKQGKKIIGYFCCYVPVEIITAAGLVPYRITGNVKEPVTQADAYLETVMCPFVRSCFDRSIKGEYDFLDGLVIPHSCDSIQRIYDIWRYHKKDLYAHFVDVPHMVNPAAYRFFKRELLHFKSSLESFAGVEISDQKLGEAVKLHNENRALLRELYNLRKPDPPLVSGVEVMETVVATLNLPVEEGNELLRGVIADIPHRKDRPSRKEVRVLIYGAETDDTPFIKLVEDSSSNVVMDDMCYGSRWFWHDVKETADPLDGLASRYLDNIVCPRTYRELVGSHEADLENRFSYLMDYIKEFNVNAVILYVIRFCDTYECDVPDVKEYLEKAGLPVLHLEDDYSVMSIGRLGTRVQAFLEMVGESTEE